MAGLPRFYVRPENIGPGKIQLSPSVVRHAVKTLRLRPGDPLILFDGKGAEYQCELTLEKGQTFSAQIKIALPPQSEPRPRIFLYQAPIKKTRWEWLLEKSTELGVHTIIPLLTRYAEISMTRNFEKNLARWESIVESACEQSERSHLPRLSVPVSFEEALRNGPGGRLLFYEGRGTPWLKTALPQIAHREEISIFIGPEGGFSEEEALKAQSLDIPLVSLGERILRAETAAISAVDRILFWSADFLP